MDEKEMIKFTIGSDNKSYAANGDKLAFITPDQLHYISDVVKQNNIDKNRLPALYTYYGIKGQFTGSNICFVDYDTHTGVDDVLKNADVLFNRMPDIIAMQKSYSGKLHLIVLLDRVYYDKDEYTNASALMTACVTAMINTLFRINYYMITDDKGNPSVDYHNTNWFQKFNVSGNDFVINQNIIQGYSLGIINEYRTDFINKYPYIFKSCKQECKNKEYVEISGSDYVCGDNTNMTVIDSSVEIDGMRGNDIRWRISRIADHLFGDNAKEWCDDRFCCNDGKSIYTKGNPTPIKYSILNWLKSNGYIKAKVQSTESLISDIKIDDAYEVKTFLSDEYYDMIEDAINENDVISIVSSTGTGKTVLINKLAAKHNSIIATPFNAMRNLYNGVVYHRNATQQLSLFDDDVVCGNIQMIKSVDDYDNEQSCVMVYDKLTQIDINQISGKIIFIDESHILFTSQDFRDRLIKLFTVLNELKTRCKIVLVSATPLKEIEKLGCKKTLTFYKQRKIINTYWVDVNTQSAARTYIEKCIDEYKNKNIYDRIVLFSDASTRYVYDNALVKMKSKQLVKNMYTILHAQYDNGDMSRITQTEILDTKVTLSTSVGYNGLNFKNKNERTLILIDFCIGTDLSWKIIQAVGRMRNCDVDLIVVAHNITTHLQSCITISQIYDNAKADDRLFKFNRKYLKPDVRKAIEEIDAYQQQLSTKEQVVNDLKGLGYFNIVNEREQEIDEINTNLMKKIVEKLVRKIVLENEIETLTMQFMLNKPVDGTEYYDDLCRTVDNAQSIYNIQYKFIKELCSIKQSGIKTEINNLCDVVRLVMSDWNEVREIISNIKMGLKMTDDKIVIKRMSDQIRKIENNMEKYHQCVVPENMFDNADCDDVICQYLDNLREKETHKREMKSIAGSYTNPIKVVWNDTNETKFYASKTDAMKAIGCNPNTFSKLFKGIQSKKYNVSVTKCNDTDNVA